MSQHAGPYRSTTLEPPRELSWWTGWRIVAAIALGLAALMAVAVRGARAHERAQVAAYCGVIRARMHLNEARLVAQDQGLLLWEDTRESLSAGDQFDPQWVLNRRWRAFSARAARSAEPIVTVTTRNRIYRGECEVDHRDGVVTATRVAE